MTQLRLTELRAGRGAPAHKPTVSDVERWASIDDELAGILGDLEWHDREVLRVRLRGAVIHSAVDRLRAKRGLDIECRPAKGRGRGATEYKQHDPPRPGKGKRRTRDAR